MTTPPGLVPGGVSVSAFAEQLRAAAAAADIACLRISGLDAQRVTAVAANLLGLAQDSGIAVLLDDAALAARLRADGVHLGDPGLYRDARRLLGADAIVGVACPLERHGAMTAAEDGADYVQFAPEGAATDEARALVSWWAEMMTTPSVVSIDFSDAESGRSQSAAFISAGADFLAPSPSIWTLPDPAKILAGLLRPA